jgi:hypothetical protein
MSAIPAWKNWFLNWVTHNEMEMKFPDYVYIGRRVVRLEGFDLITDDYDVDSLLAPGGHRMYLAIVMSAGWDGTGTKSVGTYTPDITGTPLSISFATYRDATFNSLPDGITFDRAIFCGSSNNQMNYPQWVCDLPTPITVTDWDTTTDVLVLNEGDLVFGGFTGDGVEMSAELDDMMQYFFSNDDSYTPDHPMFPFPSGFDEPLTAAARVPYTDRFIDLRDTSGNVITGGYYRSFPIYKFNHTVNTYQERHLKWGFVDNAVSGAVENTAELWWQVPSCTVRYWSIRTGNEELLRGQFSSDLVCSAGDVVSIAATDLGLSIT